MRTREEFHNITSNIPEINEDILEYSEEETMIVSNLMGEFHAQMLLLQKGLKHFERKGEDAAKERVTQKYDWVYFKALAVKDLTHLERECAQELVLFLTKNKDGKMKGRIAYNGK